MTGSALYTRYCSIKVVGGSPGSDSMIIVEGGLQGDGVILSMTIF